MNELLTVEILEAYGFQRSHAVNTQQGDVYVKDGLVISVLQDGIFGIEGSSRVQLTSVAHLQDMYRKLTGKKLKK